MQGGKTIITCAVTGNLTKPEQTPHLPMNPGPDVVINTPGNVRKMAKAINDAGVLPELEVFDSGDMHLARDLLADGTLRGPGLFTIVMGVKYGFASTPETLFYARQLLPAGARWSAFGIGRAFGG